MPRKAYIVLFVLMATPYISNGGGPPGQLKLHIPSRIERNPAHLRQPIPDFKDPTTDNGVDLDKLYERNNIDIRIEIEDNNQKNERSTENIKAVKVTDPVQHKPTIHVIYPRGGEQIVDQRVILLGYVTSANKTKNLELFVNQKQQEMDELWRNNPVETIGSKGYPLDFLVPIEKGKNVIEIRVLDQKGFMINHVIELQGIQISETQVAPSVALENRLPDLKLKPQGQQVNENNFAVVIEDWVKQTAISDYNKGNCMYDDGRLERAVYYYRKSLRTNPLTPAFFNLGLAFKGLGNENDAKQAFEKACEQKEQRACDIISKYASISPDTLKLKEIERDGHYIKLDNDIVYDESTNLEWYVGPDRDTKCYKANRWVENLTTAGGGWRMPNIKELKTLYNKGAGKRNMTLLFKNTGWFAWSGEKKGSLFAWAFNFKHGTKRLVSRFFSDGTRGFAVRSRK